MVLIEKQNNVKKLTEIGKENGFHDATIRPLSTDKCSMSQSDWSAFLYYCSSNTRSDTLDRTLPICDKVSLTKDSENGSWVTQESERLLFN